MITVETSYLLIGLIISLLYTSYLRYKNLSYLIREEWFLILLIIMYWPLAFVVFILNLIYTMDKYIEDNKLLFRK